MFLSLLAADAAASHGHEYSANRSPSPSKRSTIPWNYLPRYPQRTLSVPVHPTSESGDPQIKRARLVDGGVQDQVSQPEDTSDDGSDKESFVSVPTHQPESELVEVSEVISTNPSTSHDTKSISERHPRQRRSKTSYSLAHAPPRGKSIYRAKSLFSPTTVLQIFDTSSSSRPIPAFEAIQASLFNPTMSRSCADLHPKRLGPNDMVILEAGKHGNVNDKHPHAESTWEARRILSVICTCGGNTTINMKDAAWTVKTLPNGRYDFIPTDNGVSDVPEVRWVRARQQLGSRRGRRSIPNDSISRLTFSTILPDTRRHPVIASIVPEVGGRIDIMDQYAIPTSSGGSETSSIFAGSETRTKTASLDSVYLPAEQLIPTDPRLRDIICATGIWIAALEGLSPVQTESTIPPRPVSRSRSFSSQMSADQTQPRRRSFVGDVTIPIRLKPTETQSSSKLGKLVKSLRKRQGS